MSALDVFRKFQHMLETGDFGAIPEVVDVDAYTENCVGMTGWTLGFDTALANFQHGMLSTFSDLRTDESDVVDDGATLVVRMRVTATHSGKPFFGVPSSNKPVSFDAIDMYRLGEDGRIRWRFMLCDWNGVRLQLLGEVPDLPTTPSRIAVQAQS